MVDYIQRNTFFTIFTGLVFLSALWLPDLLAPSSLYTHEATQPLQSWLLSLNWMTGRSGLWINIGLTLLSAGVLFLSNIKHLFASNDKLMFLLYLLLSSALPAALYYPETRLASTFVIIGLYCLFQTYQQKTALSQLFLAAMWISLASLFYFPAIVVLLTVIISLLNTRSFIWRDWTALFAGLLCPYFYLGVYLFWTENTITDIWSGLCQNFHPLSLPVVAHNLYEYIFIITLSVMIIWVIFTQKIKGALNKIKAVHLRRANNWLLACLLISAIVLQPPYCSMMPLLSIPLSIIIANADKRLWVKKGYIFLLLLLLTAIIGSRIA